MELKRFRVVLWRKRYKKFERSPPILAVTGIGAPARWVLNTGAGNGENLGL
jgi:hypothetical protein